MHFVHSKCSISANSYDSCPRHQVVIFFMFYWGKVAEGTTIKPSKPTNKIISDGLNSYEENKSNE